MCELVKHFTICNKIIKVSFRRIWHCTVLIYTEHLEAVNNF